MRHQIRYTPSSVMRLRPDRDNPHRYQRVARRHGAVWNVYYRLSPAAWGHGFATELASAARAAAAASNLQLPVVAYLLEHNTGSRRTAERVGLTLAWRGPDHGNPDPAAARLIYADRHLSADLLEQLTSTP